jgi:hypothetical protein
MLLNISRYLIIVKKKIIKIKLFTFNPYIILIEEVILVLSVFSKIIYCYNIEF